MQEPLQAHIKRVHGTQKAYAEHYNFTESEVSRWKKNRVWVIDGELYAPIRKQVRREVDKK